MNICEQCGYHLKISSLDIIELSIDPGTWDPMDEEMFSLDPIDFHSEEEPYKDRIDSYKKDRINRDHSNRHRSTKRHSRSNWGYGFSVYGG